MNIYIELWKAKDSWRALPSAEKQSYMGQMQSSIPAFLEKGAVIYSWGKNNLAQDQQGDFSWFAIWEFPNTELIAEFESMLQNAGWYNYFDQVNICGANVGPEAIIGQMLESTV